MPILIKMFHYLIYTPIRPNLNRRKMGDSPHELRHRVLNRIDNRSTDYRKIAAITPFLIGK